VLKLKYERLVKIYRLGERSAAASATCRGPAGVEGPLSPDCEPSRVVHSLIAKCAGRPRETRGLRVGARNDEPFMPRPRSPEATRRARCGLAPKQQCERLGENLAAATR